MKHILSANPVNKLLLATIVFVNALLYWTKVKVQVHLSV